MVNSRQRGKCSKMRMLSADATKASSGVFTCQTCNSLFTCLEYYQQHRKDHAQNDAGVKLLTCCHCTYVSDNSFHYNWHIMSHASQDPHRCEICAPEEVVENGWNGYGSSFGNGNSDNPSRISDCIIGFGKRSIATQSSEDLIYPASPPPPYQQHTNNVLTSTKSTTMRAREDIYNNLETIDASGLLDSDEPNQQVKDESEETEEEEPADDEEVEEEEEEDDNNQNEQPYQEVTDQQQQTSFYQDQSQQNDDDETEEEEEEEDEEGNQSFQYSYQEQQMSQNGDYQEIGEEIEDDGTIEDEEAQDLILQDETGTEEFNQNQDYIQQQDSMMMDQSYQEEENDVDDVHDYGDAMEGDDDVEEDEEEEEEEEEDESIAIGDELSRKAPDVYDFNSDDDAGLVVPENDPNLQNGLAVAAPVPPNMPALTANAHQPTIQLQPTFVHHQPHPHAPHPHHHHQQQQAIPANLQPQHSQHPHHHQGPAPGQAGPPASLQNATFQLQPHMTNAPHHSHFITINGANNTFVTAAPQQGANSFQIDPSAFTNGQPIRLISIPAAFNPTPTQQQAPPPPLQQHQQMQQVAQHHPLSQQQQQLQQQQPQPQQLQQQQQQTTQATPTQPAPVTKVKRAKKTAPTNLVDALQNGGQLNSESGEGGTIPPPFVPTKGKGKGNRKPRINFISVINGITVGADGIRRKFQCSHCGNGKSFKTKSHLQRHMLTHTGEKPYQCSDCGSKFNQSSSLRNHIIAIHTKKFPHVCTICGKGFLMPAVLQKHIQQTGHYSAENASNLAGAGTAVGSPACGLSEDANSKDDALMNGSHDHLAHHHQHNNSIKSEDDHMFAFAPNS